MHNPCSERTGKSAVRSSKPLGVKTNMQSVMNRLWYPKHEDAVWARWLFLILLPVFLLLGFVLPDMLWLVLFLLVFVIRAVVMVRSSQTHPPSTDFTVNLGQQSRSGLYMCRASAFVLPILSFLTYFLVQEILFLVLSVMCIISTFFLALSKLPETIFFFLCFLYVFLSFVVSLYQAGVPGTMTLLILMLIILPEAFAMHFRYKKSGALEYV